MRMSEDKIPDRVSTFQITEHPRIIYVEITGEDLDRNIDYI